MSDCPTVQLSAKNRLQSIDSSFRTSKFDFKIDFTLLTPIGNQRTNENILVIDFSPIGLWSEPESNVHSDNRRHLVVLHSDPHIFIYRQFGCFSDRRAHDYAHRERRRPGLTEQNSIRHPWERLNHDLLPGLTDRDLLQDVALHGEQTDRLRQDLRGRRSTSTRRQLCFLNGKVSEKL